MSLPSQSSRTGQASARSYVYKRRRRGVPPGIALSAAGLGLIAILIIASIWFFDKPGPAEANASDDTAKIVEPINPAPGGTPPTVIDQSTAQRTPAARPADDLIEGLNSQPAPRTPGGLLTNANPVESPPTQTGTSATRTVEGPTTLPDPTSATPRETTTARPTVQPDNSAAATQRIIQLAQERIDNNDPVGARRILSDALFRPGSGELDKSVLRTRLTELNDRILFSPRVIAGDPITTAYEIQPGDSLSRIASRQNLGTHWKLIQRVNEISDPRRIRVGQTIKLVRGTFHAIVEKSAYRLDLYHGPVSDQSQWVYIKSLPVGLGEEGSTPEGLFKVRDDGKLENPGWVNPRKPSERYQPDDPDNPIGEFWVGLEGLGADAAYVGYGIHGTTEPDSIGDQQSMGCVRLLDDDIALVYELLTEDESLVLIRR